MDVDASDFPRFVVLPRSVLFALDAAGVDVAAQLRAIGVDVPRPYVSVRLATTEVELFLARSLDCVSDPEFGLLAGSRIRPELFGVAGFAAMAAPTLGQALALLARYKRMLWTDTIELSCTATGTTVRTTTRTVDPRHARIRADAELASVMAMSRLFTAVQELHPLRVSLRGDVVARRDSYEAFFLCPVLFGQTSDELLFATTDVNRPLVTSAPELLPLFEDEAERLLKESGGDDIVERVEATLRGQFRGHVPRIETVAELLGTSRRSLQRRLAERGRSFSSLIDEVRRQVACELLARTDVEIAEISFLLGFAHPNALYRAFRRWEQTTPIEHRRRQRSRQLREQLEEPRWATSDGAKWNTKRKTGNRSRPPLSHS
jgi:AraC-like DNA-binding protein